MNSKIYKSKVNFWWALAVFSFLGVPFVWAIISANCMAAVLFGIFILFALHIFQNTAYQIVQSHLSIQAGFLLHYNVPIAEIDKIIVTLKPNKEAPALSPKRLEIILKNGKSYLISPKVAERQEFVEELQKINPKIKWDG